jgi:hypothetical protein
MKNKFRFPWLPTIAIFASLCLFVSCYALPVGSINRDTIENRQPGITYSVFYESLRPYGRWIDHPRYGFVWVPDVEAGFFPYGTNGYWLLTDWGWTWYSYYAWGWGPFHYGRWFYDPFYGWTWMPGYQWSSAWVVWRYSDGYYGWGPIGPGVSLTFAFSNAYYLPHTHWRFIQNRHMGRKDIDHYYAGFGGYMDFLRQSKVIPNVREDLQRKISYHAGPTMHDVEIATNKKWTTLNVQESEKPGQQLRNGSVILYKPEISQAKVSKPKAVERWKGRAPEDVIELNQPEQDHDRIMQQDRQHQDKPELIQEAPIAPKQEPLRPRTDETNQPQLPPPQKETQHELPMIPIPEHNIKPPVDKPIPLPKTDLQRQPGRQIRPQPPVIKPAPKKNNNGKNRIPRNR